MATFKKKTVYRVRGRGVFPDDMLRYDQAWPTSEGVGIMHVTRADTELYREPREVELQCYGYPCVERWASFGWTVVAQREYSI